MTTPPEIGHGTFDVHQCRTIVDYWFADVRAAIDHVVAELVAEGRGDVEVQIYNGRTVSGLGNRHEGYKTRKLQLGHVVSGEGHGNTVVVTIWLWIDAGLVASERMA